MNAVMPNGKRLEHAALSIVVWEESKPQRRIACRRNPDSRQERTFADSETDARVRPAAGVLGRSLHHRRGERARTTAQRATLKPPQQLEPMKGLLDKMTPTLLPTYATAIRATPANQLNDPLSIPELAMDAAIVGGKHVQMVYAPFDDVNRRARIVLVGMTPGRVQAANALRSARSALLAGDSIKEAAAKAKVFASFSGPMRNNLVRLLDSVGVARLLDISSTAQLWAERLDLVHFTSALRYPVFVDGDNWSGQPDMVRTPQLRRWLETYAGTELADLGDALLVPLGPKVSAAMRHLASLGLVDGARILDGLPHPSGANAERIAFFLGEKPAEQCSSKTNPQSLSRAKAEIIAKVEAARSMGM
jgi:hypothetical protein